jgi:hypothetical protein
MQRSPDELIALMERGAAMKAVLDSPAFHETVDYLTEYHKAAVFACRPGYQADADALHHHHLMQFALTEIVAQLQQWMVAGEQAAQAHEWALQHGDTD